MRSFFIIVIILSTIGCTKSTNTNIAPTTISLEIPIEKQTILREPSEAFKAYWYNGSAEITSYTLTQARYGELHHGTSVLIYVTEDFLPKVQVKADQANATTIPILKLNATKNFTTGIYPYTIIQSTFYPVSDNQHALKVSSAIQEWCGHVYAQINNRGQYEIISHSYFQSEADQTFSLEKTILENELWTKIRIDPTSLPKGTLQIIPSLEFCRLKHYPIQAYHAETSLKKEGDHSIYSITYPELKRSIHITFNTSFPHEIEGWTETVISGYGTHAKTLTTTATKKVRILSDYWNKNSNKDRKLRTRLGLQ